MKPLYYQYAEGVLDKTISAPSQVRKQCELFKHDYEVLQYKENAEFWWDFETEKLIDKWLKLFVFARGALAGKSIGDYLAKWQAFAIYNTLCWKLIDDETGEKVDVRRYKTIILTMARKQSKSVLCAIIHLLTMILDEKNAYHYLSANNTEQAAVVFKELVGIINSSKTISKLFKVQTNRIFYLPKNVELRVLSGDSKTKDGLFPYVFCCDEMGAKNSMADMYNVLSSGQTGVRNPLQLLISTSYPIKSGYNYWNKKVENMIDNTMNDGILDPRMFGLAYVIDEPFELVEHNDEMVERWTTSEAWFEANPLAQEVPAIYKDKRDAYIGAKRNPKELENFKVKELNIWLEDTNENEEIFIDLTTLEQYEYPKAQKWEFWRDKKQVMIGVDLAMARDNTSITFLWHDVNNEEGNGAGITYVKNLVLYPEALEAEKVQAEDLPYDLWSTKEYGYCMPFGKEVVAWEKIGPYIQHEILEKYNIKLGSFLYDRKYADEISDYFDQYVSMEMQPIVVEQNSAHLGNVISKLNKELYDGKIRYGSNGLFVSSLTNAVIHYPMGKPYIKKPEHGKHTKKVDSLFSTLNAFKGHLFFKQDGRYESITNYIV